MSLPLQGLRIIAIEQYGAGPFGTQHLADLGADVLKIENRQTGGDIGRQVGPYFFGPGDSHFHQALNRNKRSMTLNLKAPDAREVLHKLVAQGDALFNNLRGDLPGKLGLDYKALSAVNPEIVCVHLSAYGRQGSRKNWPGYDYLMQAEAGYLHLTGEPDGPPTRCGLSIVDFMTGTTAAMALLAGIIEARRCGQGRDLDVSLFDVAIHNQAYLSAWYLNGGHNTRRVERSGHPSLVPSELYRTRDGWIFLMCNKEKFWCSLAELVNRPEWISDPQFCDYKARLANRIQLRQELDKVLSTDDTANWLARFAGKVPAAPVLDVAQALENPFLTEQQRITDFQHAGQGTIRGIASPVRITDVLPAKAAPQMGEHTDEVLQALGYTEAQIEALHDRGVV